MDQAFAPSSDQPTNQPTSQATNQLINQHQQEASTFPLLAEVILSNVRILCIYPQRKKLKAYHFSYTV